MTAGEAGCRTAGEAGCRTAGEAGCRMVPVTSQGGPVGTEPARRAERPVRLFSSQLNLSRPDTSPAGHGSHDDTPPGGGRGGICMYTLSISHRGV